MTLSIVFLVVGLIFFIVSSFYFVFSLLMVIVLILILILFSNSVSTLFSLILVLVYAGAMMIFIGYICAVSPNPIFLPFIGFFNLIVLIAFLIASFCLSTFPFYSSFSVNLLDFFYSSEGVVAFIFVVLVLFFLLILVSSQIFFPKGPFRSV